MQWLVVPISSGVPVICSPEHSRWLDRRLGRVDIGLQFIRNSMVDEWLSHIGGASYNIRAVSISIQLLCAFLKIVLEIFTRTYANPLSW